MTKTQARNDRLWLGKPELAHTFTCSPEAGDNDVNELLHARAGASTEARRIAMTLCPIALVAGCKKCPAFSVCLLKGVVGDYRKEDESQTKPQASDKDKK